MHNTRVNILAALFAMIFVSCVATERSGANGVVSGLEITTSPSRPDLISGGDARIIVRSDDVSAFEGMRVFLNGRLVDVSHELRGNEAHFILTGLMDGENDVRVETLRGISADIVLVNHPIGGPLLSGPQIEPWICATPEAQPESAGQAATYANGLQGWPMDQQCNVTPEVSYYYRTTEDVCSAKLGEADACFRLLDIATPYPEDMAKTTTEDERRIDYIVRVERGAINRGLYDIAVLHDPSAAENDLSEWNRKIVWFFGGSTGHLRRQSQPASTWALDYPLSKGFMVVVSSMTDASQNSNRVVSAETVLMLKEYISDTYDLVRYTIGHGCSAGSMQQNVIASMYPGALDGLVLACSYPDSDGHGQDVFDALLLRRYFESPEFSAQNENLSKGEIMQKRADIAGHKDAGSVDNWGRFRFGYMAGVWGEEPMSNGCRLPNDIVYDAEKNPEGIRCTSSDHSINIWGAYPGSHAGRSVKDNEGLQYGLGALLAGKITPEDFVLLNVSVGGINLNGEFTPERTIGDREAIAIAYKTGLISDGHVMASTPIIDLRGDENSSVHYNWSSWSLRDRLMDANGNIDNHIMWRVGLPGGGAPWISPLWLESRLPQDSLDVMDAWLSGIEADSTPGTSVEKMRRNRPTNAFDFCYLGTDYTNKVTDESLCDEDPGLKYYSSIRQVAGGARASDVLKCQLKPFDRDAYQGKLDDEQLKRLEAAFSTGVCDWSVPGIEQAPSLGGWFSFADGPGGAPLPQ